MTSTIARSGAAVAVLLAGLGLSACVALPPSVSAEPTPTAPSSAAQSETEAPEADEPAPTASSEPASPPEAEQGTRENPWLAGEELTTDEWQLVIGATNLDANAAVAEGNMFNDPPEAGHQYIQVPVTVTYLGDDSATTLDIQIAYVSASGETYESWDALVAVPDDNQGQELYTGGTATFSEYLMVPSDAVAEGLLRVEVGLIGGAQGWVTLG